MANKPLVIKVAVLAMLLIGCTSVAMLAGFGTMAAGVVGILSSALAGVCFQLHSTHQKAGALRTAMDELQSQFIYLHERQGQAEAKLQDMARRSIDSPSLALHATATDIDVLGSLVRDLAKTVAEHDGKIAEQEKARTQAAAIVPVQSMARPLMPDRSTAAINQLPLSPRKPALPQSFQADAEFGFTADLPRQESSVASVPPIASVAPSPAVLAELRSTLSSALAGNHLELCLQPIVMLPQRKARGYEATLTLKGEKATGQAGPDLRRIALASGLQKDFDRALFGRTTHIARVLRARNREVAMSLSVSVDSLLDADFRTMVEDLVRNDGKLAHSILLEIDDADLRAAGPIGRERVMAIGRLGIGLGLALHDSLRFSATDLVTTGIRQLRVPASLMQSAAQNGGDIADIHPADVSELLNRNSIDLLVSDVSDEDTIREMLDFAAPYAQGDLFGKARTVRPEVLEPKPVGTAGPRTAPVAPVQEQALAGQTTGPRNIPRQSFRSLLRRA